MTKTLSEQLCEIVGLDYEKHFGVGYRKLNFEQPDNFVKLWELKIKHPDTKELLSLNAYLKFDNRQSFLLSLLLKFQLWSSDFASEYQKQWLQTVKQSIRDYDGWVWR